MPNEVNVFGNANHEIDLDALNTCQGSKSQVLRIKKSHLKALDQPSNRCSAESTNLNTSACIANFIEREIGCNPNIQGSRYSKRPLCNSTSQLARLQNISNKLLQSHDNDIYAMTGCLSSCEKDFYNIIPEAMTCLNNGVGGSLKFLLKFRIRDRSYEERKQYAIYDNDSFIADVGGYMGLLLGCSVMSLYNAIESLIKRVIIRPLIGHKISGRGAKSQVI